MISASDEPILNEPCGRMSCPPGWGRDRDDSRRLGDLELWLVWRGKGWMKTARREYALLPGFCALMRPGGIYDAGQDETNPLTISFIHFDLLREKGDRRGSIEYGRLPEFFEIDDIEYFDAVTWRIIELHASDPRLGAILLKALLLDLLQRPRLEQMGLAAAGNTDAGAGYLAACGVDPGRLRPAAHSA